jgi:hypothetical protein
MEVETAYALTKFPASVQYPYFLAGVARGNFTFMGSSLNYLMRAKLFEPEAHNDVTIGLQLVQSLGKAAHNLVALRSTANSYWSDGKRQISSAMATFNEVAERLGASHFTKDYTVSSVISHRRDIFGTLQILQDEGNQAEFDRVIMGDIMIASEMFVCNAVEHGWPAPGYSSGNVHPWHIQRLT